jgi:hypothetical protein
MVKQSFYDPLLNDGQGNGDDDVKSIQRQIKDMRMEGDYYFESYAGVDIHEQMIKVFYFILYSVLILTTI